MNAVIKPQPHEPESAQRPSLRFPDEWLTTEEAAAVLGYSPATLANWRRTGNGPAFYRTKPVRYSRSDLDSWLASTRCDPAR